jgi:hypothetical protein
MESEDVERYNQWVNLRKRYTEICIAFKEMDLPALVMLAILDEVSPNEFPINQKYDLVRMVKHADRIVPCMLQEKEMRTMEERELEEKKREQLLRQNAFMSKLKNLVLNK